MAVNFKIYQSNRKGGTNGKFYARAAHRETINTKDLAEVMQNNSTVKRSDIVAVLTELSEVLRPFCMLCLSAISMFLITFAKVQSGASDVKFLAEKISFKLIFSWYKGY